MSTLTSASTLAQVKAAYADNASYVEDNSVAKCRAFITACTILLLNLPAEQGTREAQLVRQRQLPYDGGLEMVSKSGDPIRRSHRRVAPQADGTRFPLVPFLRQRHLPMSDEP